MSKLAADEGKRSWADLTPRVLSAFVLMPVTYAALHLGGYWFAGLFGLVFAGACREWEIMCTSRRPDVIGYILVLLVALVAPAYVGFGLAGAAIAGGAGTALALVAPSPSRLWRTFGVVYFAVVVIAAVAMRGTGNLGILAGLFLAFSVWMTDTGAFFTGRQIGGAKLSPEISPTKTWSGALGGLIFGVAIATLFWMVAVPSPWWIGLGFAALLSFVGQIGDLVESAIKRHFRIKDSSDLIPGHGGLMDRLDSLTFALLVLFSIGLLRGGIDAIAAGVLIW
jgi:phosphatidate cytidylyltransferase